MGGGTLVTKFKEFSFRSLTRSIVIRAVCLLSTDSGIFSNTSLAGFSGFARKRVHSLHKLTSLRADKGIFPVRISSSFI